MAACILFIMLSLATISIGVATRDGMNPFPSNGGSTQPVSAIPPSEDPFLIKTSTDITCSGSVTESVSFDWAYTNKNLSDNTLTNDERVAQIRYDEHTSAIGGYTEFSKDFTADGLNVPNLHVDKKVGFIANQSMTGGLDSTEDAGIFIMSEGITGGGSGTGGLCIWAQHACVPPSCEIAVAGSQLKDVTRVNSYTITSVQTSESPRLHHEITAKGAMMGDNRTYGAGIGTGTVSAGMKVDVREGNNCNNTVHPLGSRLRYTTISTATGRWNSFGKSMTYTSAIPALQIPGQYPLFPWY
ncbi:MAG: hypothetical protein C4B56_07265 [Candidatus Methanophagaceae archaeon]|nr:MAG: hypothetical protein C4B56_07265 [Methanophagales archaeon]